MAIQGERPLHSWPPKGSTTLVSLLKSNLWFSANHDLVMSVEIGSLGRFSSAPTSPFPLQNKSSKPYGSLVPLHLSPLVIDRLIPSQVII